MRAQRRLRSEQRIAELHAVIAPRILRIHRVEGPGGGLGPSGGLGDRGCNGGTF
jgi:hypothetical protein